MSDVLNNDMSKVCGLVEAINEQIGYLRTAKDNFYSGGHTFESTYSTYLEDLERDQNELRTLLGAKSEPFETEVNQDIIDFRHKLIDLTLNKSYLGGGVMCNDGHTNVMTPDKKRVLEDMLTLFNIHFGERGYDLG